MTYVIREMKQEDIHAVQSVAKIACMIHTKALFERDSRQFLDEAYSDEKMKYRLENTHLFVAEEEEKSLALKFFTC